MSDTIYQRLTAHWPHYDEPVTTTPQEAPMSVLATIKTDVEKAFGDLETVVKGALPQIDRVEQEVLANPVVQVLVDVLDALDPALQPVLSSVIAAFGAQQAAAAPAAPAAEPEPVPEPDLPQEPVPAQ